MVGCDDNIEAVSQAMVFDLVSDVAHSAVNLLDHLSAFWGIWSIFMSYQIRFSKVQCDKVKVIFVEPLSNHFVNVQLPICLI